ncbi:MAG: hypothetical protein CV081_12770 [Nitrospira sp. LK265]|nr:hypothetical protein [Nitrospira sp. LK265]
MARRGVSVALVQEIQRLIDEGLSDRKIARALRCRRRRVAEIRSMGPAAQAPFVSAVMTPPAPHEPAWATVIEWAAVLDEIGRGYEIKRIWEERAASLTGYPNFWKYLTRRYPAILRSTVSIREFAPGTQCEVDWAGTTIPWWDERGREHSAHVFVGTLCHSQLIFAHAFENEKKEAWLAGHVKMYSFFKGVPRVTAPDNLKAGVTRTHLYDPDLNPSYCELAVHYGTAVVPARARRPKDKALGELAVKLVTRLFAWMFRHRRFRSLSEINEALAQACERINTKPHSRFKISRLARFEQNEKPALKPLPDVPFEQVEWKTARVHPDSTVSADSATYSVPHIHRGKEVRVKLTGNQVAVFLGMDRIALHPRDKSRSGARVIDPTHLPPNAQAYLENTPQFLLSQARFVSSDLRDLIDELFQQDALGHLRRVQGLVRRARSEIDALGRLDAEPRIAQAIDQMRRFGKIRVSYFDSQLTLLRQRSLTPAPDREIKRIPGNPMLRHEARTPEQLGLQLASPPLMENQS